MSIMDGTGIREFDDAVQNHKAEIDSLKVKLQTASDKDAVARDLGAIFHDIVSDARGQISNRDGDAANDSATEGQDKRAVDAIGQDLEAFVTKMASDGTHFMLGGDTLRKLSEIRWINTIDEDTREVIAHDGSKILVDRKLNQEAFGTALDFENQLRKVAADQEPFKLLEQGYGLLGKTEVQDVIARLKDGKPGTVPVVEMKGDHLVTLRFTDKNGVEQKYFAHDDHSPDAFRSLRAVGAYLLIPGLRQFFMPPPEFKPEPQPEPEPEPEPAPKAKPEDVAEGGYELIEDDLIAGERIKEPPTEELKKSKEYKDKKVKLELPMFFNGKGHTVGQFSDPEEFPGFMRFHYTDEDGNEKKYYIEEAKTPNLYQKAKHMALHVQTLTTAQEKKWSVWDQGRFNTTESQLREIENHFQNEELGIIGVKFYDANAERDVGRGNGNLNLLNSYHKGEYIIFSKERTPEAYDVIRRYIQGPIDLGDGMDGNDHRDQGLNGLYSADHWTDYDKPGDLTLEAADPND
jgi:hypothetical protein